MARFRALLNASFLESRLDVEADVFELPVEGPPKQVPIEADCFSGLQARNT